MNLSLTRQYGFPANSAWPRFVSWSLRLTILSVALLLAFSSIAGAMVPQAGDFLATVRYNAGCYPSFFSTLGELNQACATRISQDTCRTPGCTVNYVFVGEDPPCLSVPNPVNSINGVLHPGRCVELNRTLNNATPPQTSTVWAVISAGLNYTCPVGYYIYPGNVSPYLSTTQNQWQFCRPQNNYKLPPQEPSGPQQCTLAGNPIDLTTGIKIQTEIDYRGPDGLEFTRTYRSSTGQFSSILTSRYSAANTSGNPLGSSGAFYHWNYQTNGKWFSARMPIMTDSPNDANHYLYTADGKRYQFIENSSGTPIAGAGTHIKVIKNINPASQGVWLWELVREDDSHERYNAQGLLTSKWPRSGTGLSITYSYSDVNTPTAVAPVPGLMIRITNPYGHSLNFTYDENARLASMTDPAGGVYTYAYNDPAASDNLTSVTYPNGTGKTYFYNEPAYLPPVNASVANPLYPHALTGIIDENNKRYATFTYDTDGKAIATEHAGGVNKYSVYYGTDTRGNPMTTVIDPLNSAYIFNLQSVQGINKITGQNQPAGAGCTAASSNTGYDGNGNVSSRTDFNGNTTCYAYNARNLETVRLEGLAPGTSCPTNLSNYSPAPNTAERKITTQWHGVWRVPTLIAEPKRLTTLVWGDSTSDCGSTGVLCRKTLQSTNDNTGSLGATATPVGSRSWNYGYNSLGQLLSVDGPRNNLTDVIDQISYTYYPNNAAMVNNRKLLNTVADKEGHVTSYNSYDVHGRPSQIKTANGVIINLDYNLRGQLKTLTVAGRTTQILYKPNGLLATVTTPATGTTSYGYDDAQRLRNITNDAGEKIAYSLDNLDNRTQDRTYANLATTPATELNRRFDGLGRQWRILNAANQLIREYNYDAQGNLGSSTDHPDATTANNQVTYYSGYDALNRLTQLTDALNGLIEFGYDGLDHLTQITDPRTNATHYAISGLDNLMQEDSPDRGITNNTPFDPAGNLKTAVDARGNTATYSYDSIDRLLSATYHPAVNSLPPNNVDVVLNYRYDGKPNPANANAAGRLTHIDDPTGATDWLYDSEGRLQNKTQTTGALSRSLSYSYDPVTGRLDTATYPSGSRIKYGYDSAGRPNSLSYAAAGAPFTALLDNISYQPLGPTNSYRLAGVTGTPTISRHLNSDGLVDSYTLIDVSKTLGYDRLGNLTLLGDSGTIANDQSYRYDKLNRLTDFGAPGLSQHYDYDAGGNRTAKTSNGITTRYQPEAASNRLSTLNAPPYHYDLAGNLTDNGSLTLSYDSRNRLVQANTPGGVVYRYGINALGQRVSKTSTALTSGGRVYVYDEAGRLIGEYDNTGARQQEHLWLGDQPIAVIGGGGVIYPVLSDPLNTPRQIINSNKQLLWRWDNLDPFGTNIPTQVSPGLPFGYNLRFPGQYADFETGLFYNNYRDYNPKDGRYPQSDPIGLRGGVNTYAYVGNNPVNLIDPLGLEPICAASGQRIVCTDGMRPPPEGTPLNGPLSPVGVAATAVEAGLAACPIGKGVQATKYGPLNPGPLATDIANTFRSGTYTGRTLSSDQTLYRVMSRNGNPTGSYWTSTKPQGPLQSVIDSALDQNWGNSATEVVTAIVPAGTTIYEGAAAAQRGLVGGGNQIYIPQVNSSWIVH